MDAEELCGVVLSLEDYKSWTITNAPYMLVSLVLRTMLCGFYLYLMQRQYKRALKKSKPQVASAVRRRQIFTLFRMVSMAYIEYTYNPRALIWTLSLLITADIPCTPLPWTFGIHQLLQYQFLRVTYYFVLDFLWELVSCDTKQHWHQLRDAYFMSIASVWLMSCAITLGYHVTPYAGYILAMMVVLGDLIYPNLSWTYNERKLKAVVSSERYSQISQIIATWERKKRELIVADKPGDVALVQIYSDEIIFQNCCHLPIDQLKFMIAHARAYQTISDDLEWFFFLLSSNHTNTKTFVVGMSVFTLNWFSLPLFTT